MNRLFYRDYFCFVQLYYLVVLLPFANIIFVYSSPLSSAKPAKVESANPAASEPVSAKVINITLSSKRI